MTAARECHHDRGEWSTLQLNTCEDAEHNIVYWVECKTCHGITDACMTWQEATQRAMVGWWRWLRR